MEHSSASSPTEASSRPRCRAVSSPSRARHQRAPPMSSYTDLPIDTLALSSHCTDSKERTHALALGSHARTSCSRESKMPSASGSGLPPGYPGLAVALQARHNSSMTTPPRPHAPSHVDHGACTRTDTGLDARRRQLPPIWPGRRSPLQRQEAQRWLPHSCCWAVTAAIAAQAKAQLDGLLTG